MEEILTYEKNANKLSRQICCYCKKNTDKEFASEDVLSLFAISE